MMDIRSQDLRYSADSLRDNGFAPHAERDLRQAADEIDRLRKELAETTNGPDWNAIMGVIEPELRATARKLNEASFEILKPGGPADAKHAGRVFDTALEDHLNVWDRLAYCLLKMPHGTWKDEYGESVRRLVAAHPDKFGPDTRWTNIVALNESWQGAG